MKRVDSFLLLRVKMSDCTTVYKLKAPPCMSKLKCKQLSCCLQTLPTTSKTYSLPVNWQYQPHNAEFPLKLQFSCSPSWEPTMDSNHTFVLCNIYHTVHYNSSHWNYLQNKKYVTKSRDILCFHLIFQYFVAQLIDCCQNTLNINTTVIMILK